VFSVLFTQQKFVLILPAHVTKSLNIKNCFNKIVHSLRLNAVSFPFAVAFINFNAGDLSGVRFYIQHYPATYVL
jgi:hypothetical protein